MDGRELCYDRFWALFGAFGALFSAFWAPFGHFWTLLGAIRALLGAFWAVFGAPKGKAPMRSRGGIAPPKAKHLKGEAVLRSPKRPYGKAPLSASMELRR